MGSFETSLPRDSALVYQNAALKVKAGLTTEAGALISLGLRGATDGATRDRFEALKAQLPAAPAPAAK